ncbi:MAG: hypothetical protein V3T24_08940 [Longimicrobiales bacterium]
MTTFPLAPARRLFRAMATTIVPELSTADEDVWRRTEAIITQGLSGRPDAIARQLVLFIRVVNVLALFRFLRPFTALDGARRLRLLSSLENAPLLAIRRGVWGLRTLVFMGYYGQDDVRARLGYRATSLGWRAVGQGGADL